MFRVQSLWEFDVKSIFQQVNHISEGPHPDTPLFVAHPPTTKHDSYLLNTTEELIIIHTPIKPDCNIP